MLSVSDSIIEQTISDLQQRLPFEGVGLWIGREADVLDWLPLQNVAERPKVSYRVHPQEWLDALAKTQARKMVPLALVHSHPTAEAVPSLRDRQEWMYPELWCIIVSFRSDQPVWKAYQISLSASSSTSGAHRAHK
ncbi:Mov34/MPN/PAD-1 family protein [Tumebacillus lipolyticus]|uniref:Mov34/MPN/PAD-1 family protein n=1 Tax=Tumebacillus lipolyticus TaxID=1280370 RepID=A0ABW4ZTD6_9BACL